MIPDSPVDSKRIIVIRDAKMPFKYGNGLGSIRISTISYRMISIDLNKFLENSWVNPGVIV